MNEQEFKDRTKKLALRIIRLIEALTEYCNSKYYWQAVVAFSNFGRRELPRRLSW
jgi:hypothetical protein